MEILFTDKSNLKQVCERPFNKPVSYVLNTNVELPSYFQQLKVYTCPFTFYYNFRDGVGEGVGGWRRLSSKKL